MNINLKKILAAMLAALACASAAAACGDNSQSSGGQNTPSVQQTDAADDGAAETAAETEPDITEGLPSADYGGSDFNILLEADFYGPTFFTAELDGDVVDDAAYYRNQNVGEKYNVNIVYTANADGWYFSSEIMNMLLAGDGKYDLVSGVCPYLMPAALQGHYRNLKDNDILQLDQPWYQQHLNDGIEVGGHLLAVSGFFDMPTLARVHCTYYSSELADAYGLGSMYQLVYDGTWTFDRMISLAENVTADLDGDGEMGDNDRFGITSTWDCLDLAYNGTGFQFITTDNDGEIVLTPITQDVINANDMLYNLQMNSPTLYYSGYYQGKPHNEDNMLKMFVENRVLFMPYSMTYASRAEMREMGTYGVLPMPKFKEEQSEYGAFCSLFLSAIPVTAQDEDKSATVLEALNVYSYRDLYPAYFTIALSQKFMNDEDSRQMLDIIYKNIYCDPTYIYNEHFGVDLALSVGLQQNYASWYEKNTKKFNRLATKMMDLLSEME